jgi:hypothetical protein
MRVIMKKRRISEVQLKKARAEKLMGKTVKTSGRQTVSRPVVVTRAMVRRLEDGWFGGW